MSRAITSRAITSQATNEPSWFDIQPYTHTQRLEGDRSEGGTEESVVWCGSWTGSGRKAVKEVSGGVQALGPEASKKRGLKEKSTHGVVGGANLALSLVVLRGGIQARHAQLDTVREKEGTGGGVIKLPTIVTLDSLDGEAELCGHPSEKVDKCGESIRLCT